jgi:SAM-dependent methyltransferase
MSQLTDFNRVLVPIYETDDDGAIKPNPLFHRAYDKMHSRCIEYPFAASRVTNAQTLLDVGTAKADPAWIDWLENLPIDVHVTDYDAPLVPFRKMAFHQADVRQLPLPDNTFDQVLAVSVIEHIGLETPQVDADVLPTVDRNGDLEAARELIRVLKPGGELIMTFPFGLTENTKPGATARWYTADSLRKFEAVAQPMLFEYYEYQHIRSGKLYREYPRPKQRVGFSQQLKHTIRSQVKATPSKRVKGKKSYSERAALPGVVTWRRKSMAETKATHHGHIDGVICGIWRKS